MPNSQINFCTNTQFSDLFLINAQFTNLFCGNVRFFNLFFLAMLNFQICFSSNVQFSDWSLSICPAVGLSDWIHIKYIHQWVDYTSQHSIKVVKIKNSCFCFTEIQKSVLPICYSAQQEILLKINDSLQF